MTRRLAIFAVLLLSTETASAEKYSSGIYAEMGLGATGFLGGTGSYAAPGPAFGIRAGYDLFSWFSVGAIALASTHEATVPPPPEDEYFQLYTLGADGRITARIGRFALFAEGSLGAAIVSTNVLDRVAVTEAGNHVGPAFLAGGGIDYHTRNRHFSLGLAGDWGLYPDFDASQTVTFRLYLRYTR